MQKKSYEVIVEVQYCMKRYVFQSVLKGEMDEQSRLCRDEEFQSLEAIALKELSPQDSLVCETTNSSMPQDLNLCK